MKITTAMVCLMLLPMAGMAERELFTTPAHKISLSALTAKLNAIEPASGDSAPAPEHGAAPEASGHSEAQKSFAGKDIGAPPPLPKVKIGNKVVARQLDVLREAETSSTPAELQRRDFAQVLLNRLNYTPFAHSPQIGLQTAPITVVIFEDLACISCTTASEGINKALADIFTSPTTPTSQTSLASDTRVLWVHTPAERWQSSNLPAFYSKVAGQYHKFWEFRKAVQASPNRDPTTLFAILTELGIDPRIIRQTMLTEARRYYRELDGDTLQGKSYGIGSPPVVLVNGIRVGPSGVPLSLLPDVLQYVHNRYKAGLNEPPF